MSGQWTARKVWWVIFKYRLRAALNYAQGYAWSPVQRWRCCQHTTPFHAPDCPRRSA